MKLGDLPVPMGQVSVRRQTPKAILVVMQGGKEVWIPQVCVHDDSEVWGVGHLGKLVVKRWFALKQGWTE